MHQIYSSGARRGREVGRDVFAGGDGEDVEFVVEDEAGGVGSEGEDEAFVEAGLDGGVVFGAVAGVDVLTSPITYFSLKPSSLADTSKPGRAALTILKLYSCLKLLMLFSNKQTIPPPSTVSIVLARRFGVRAS